MSKKTKVRFGVPGDSKTFLALVDPDTTVAQFAEEACKKAKKTGLKYVWLDGGLLDDNDPLVPYLDSDSLLVVTETDDAPPDVTVDVLTGSYRNVRIVTSQESTAAAPIPAATAAPIPAATAAPIPTATAAPIPTATAAPIPTATAAPIPTQKTGLPSNQRQKSGVEQSRGGVTKNTIGLVTQEHNEILAGPGKVRLFTNANYQSMTEGEDMDVDLSWTPRQLNDRLAGVMGRLLSVNFPVMYHVFLPGGIPFQGDKSLGTFFGSIAFKDSIRKLFVCVTRRISDADLTRAFPEVCNCSNDLHKLLLAPLYPQTDIGYTHAACLLGYLNRSGMKGNVFLKSMALFTGFAPLINAVYRLTENCSVVGKDIAIVTSSLFAFYSSLLPSTLGNDRKWEYILRCSCFVIHGVEKDLEQRDLPLLSIERSAQDDALQNYCRDTNQRKEVIIWRPDIDPSGSRFALQTIRKPDGLAIENAFNTMVSFKPVAPLTLRTVAGVTITQGQKGKTLLFVCESQGKEKGTTTMVDIIDPETGKSTSRSLETMAKEAGVSEGSVQLIDPDRVKQINLVCFDESGSMKASLAGSTCRGDEPPRVVIASQYLTTFANRTYGFRVPCIQGLISFNSKIKTRSALSPLVPDFEDGIAHVDPSSTTHLWDALDKAADDLTSFALDPATKKKKYPNASLRIVVISDGDDVGSTAKPWEVAERLLKAGVVVDSVIVSTGSDSCKALCALCHITGGLSFRPKSIDEGMALFEQEAFLNYADRKRPRRYNGGHNEAAFNDLCSKAQFDVSAESQVINSANSTLPLAEPRHVIYQNRNQQIPDARRRRILRELHAAASVQDIDAEGTDPEDETKTVKLYDPELRILPFKSNLDQWRVFIKGLDGTPYENKWWYIYVTFPDTYPVRPPIFRFVSVPYHVNVSQEGRICLNLIEKGYMSTTCVVELIQQIRSLFLMPDENTPMQMSRLDMYKNNRREYDRLARESANNFAKSTLEEWLRNLHIENEAPSEFSVEITQSTAPDYLKSQISGKFIPKARRVMAETVTGKKVMYDIEELKQLLVTADRPICPCTGEPLKTSIADFQDDFI